MLVPALVSLLLLDHAVVAVGVAAGLQRPVLPAAVAAALPLPGEQKYAQFELVVVAAESE